MNIVWKITAWLASRRRIADWLIERSQHTPYFDIVKSGETYMRRWWLFNPYDHETRKPRHRWCPISIRVHHIMKPDDDRHLHDHPWNARTIILRGSYLEEVAPDSGPHMNGRFRPGLGSLRVRQRGDTARIGYGQFHRITSVSRDGVYTLFISGAHRGTWGFLVGGQKVPWREYLGIKE
ncbi:hypothetical protein GY26_16265 [Gammaproteobacteria bacterium MFB021]|nr:hypothetical protein GY26_16265 [Gammaproteobacteria bacterium MFB021]